MSKLEQQDDLHSINTLLSAVKHTIDLEIFVVKIFSGFAQTTKIKNTKCILQRIIIIAKTSVTTSIVISRETVSSSIPVGHSSSWQTRDNFFLSVR